MAYLRDDFNGTNLYSTGVLNLPQNLDFPGDYLVKGKHSTINFEIWKQIRTVDHVKIYHIKSNGTLQRCKTITTGYGTQSSGFVSFDTPLTASYPNGTYIAVFTGTEQGSTTKVQYRSPIFEIFSVDPNPEGPSFG